MLKRSLLSILAMVAMLNCQAPALQAQETASGTTRSAVLEAIDKGNQMMIAYMEHIKIGDIKGARKIANDMVAPAKNFKDTDAVEYKTFYSMIEKEYYQMTNKGNTKKVEWVQEPIADGYYLLAVLDFQEKLYKDALENIQNCVSWNPVRSAYYIERGFLYLFSGDEQNIVNAQVAYEKAIELANNTEDMAAGLRGVASVMNAKGNLPVCIAALVVSKEYDSENPDADEQILYIKKEFPDYDCNMTVKEARKLLKENNIQCDYSHTHVEVLTKMASELKMPDDKEKITILLQQGLFLEPKNVELQNKLKALK